MNGPGARRTCRNCPFLRPGTLFVFILTLLLAFPHASIGVYSPLLLASTSTQAPSAESWALEARDFLFTGEYLRALSPAQQAVKQQEADFGPDHPKVSEALNTLGLVYFQLAKIDLAQNAHERALNIREKAIGTASPEVAESVTHLARVWISKGEYSKAEHMLERALAIREKVFGQRHVLAAETLMYLAMVQGLQMHLSDALATQSGAVKIFDEDPQSPPIEHSMALTSYGVLLIRNGEFAKGKPFIERALLVQEGSLSPTHPIVARTLDHLADLEMKMGHPDQALPLAERSLNIREDRLGANHPETSASLHTLGGLYWKQGDLKQAAAYFQRALTITEQTVGKQHPVMAANLVSLGEIHRQMGNLDSAQTMLSEALAIQETTLGPEHSDVAVTLTRLSWVATSRQDHARAERLLERALVIREDLLGPSHPDVALILNDLARVNHLQEKFEVARTYYERARQVYLEVGRLNQDLDDAMVNRLHQRGHASLQDYALLLAHMSEKKTHAISLITDGFLVAEQARGYLVQAAVSKAMARLRAHRSSDVELVNRIDDLRRRRQSLWDTLHGLYGQGIRDAVQEEQIASVKQEVFDVQKALDEGLVQLEKAFPKYADLAFPQPLGLRAVQDLLRPGEALVSVYSWDRMLQVWCVRPGQAPISFSVGIPQASIVKLVQQVRGSLTSPKRPYDIEGASQLYRWLFQPLEPYLSDVTNLIIIPDEVLLPLPFGALVTEQGSAAFNQLAQHFASGGPFPHASLKAFTKIPWFIQRFPITVVPSASAFKLLRTIPSSTTTASGDSFIGFGDPVFSGQGQERGGTMPVLRGSRVAYERLRMMNALPGTKQELLAIARTLAVDPATNLFLQERATETQVRKLLDAGRLGRAQILSFATHGLLAGQLSGLVEPALVLTIPAQPSPEDDGLLTMGEILEFQLPQVNWVILSACNTAGGDGSGQGLTGLARAFFFSGAKALLVSHWSVDDQATQALMTEVFTLFGNSPSMAKSQALQQGMVKVMRQGNQDAMGYFGHPYAWAPFFLVGEGR